MRYKLVISFILFLFAAPVLAQSSVRGKIIDESGAPVPYANVFIKNNTELRAVSNIQGEYTLYLDVGYYDMIIRYVGFETVEQFIQVKDGENIYNFQLEQQAKQTSEVEIKVKRRNIAHQIIMKVAERKDQINPDKYSYIADGYLRATQKSVIQNKKSQAEIEEELKTIADPFDREERKKALELQNNASINMMEVNFERQYEAPRNVKEIRSGVQIKGNTGQLYYLTTTKSNFNFFNNILFVDDLNGSAVTSPISWAGIASYKYKLVEQFEENGKKFHKIEISARNSAQSTLNGFIVVEDEVWMVRSMSFRMEKGDLKRFDYFEIDQSFENWGDTLCVMTEQEMRYGVNYKGETSTGKTILTYSNYNFDVAFSKRHFSNEVASTAKEAYEKDSVYWTETRVKEFNDEEIFLINKRDSIEAFYNRKEYLDSIDAEFNKINIWKVLWFGVEQRNRERKEQWWLSSLAATIEPIQIAGPRISPKFFYFKKWKNERFIDTYVNASVGVLNWDPKGSARVRYLYNPFKNAYLYGNVSHTFGLIRNDAITQVFLRDNFMEVTRGLIGHSFEVFNGFFLNTDLEYNQRSPVGDYNFINLLDSLVPNQNPLEFDLYNGLFVRLGISYTPGQKFMREPYRKLILGSKFPTFMAYYEKGMNGLLGSEVDHNYIGFAMRQKLKVGTLGSTEYSIKTAKFFNSGLVREPDMKYHRRSDLFWMSSTMNSFQGLRQNYPTIDWFFEAHLEHNFYGGLINKIPFMKKTRINTIGGLGYLYVPEWNLNYAEAYAGLSRDFKFLRRRLRIGVYAVFAADNIDGALFRPKISFAIFDDREMRFNF